MLFLKYFKYSFPQGLTGYPWLCLVLMISFSLSVKGQSGSASFSVKGTVADSSGNSIPGVLVSLIAGKDTLKTSSSIDGKFTILKVPSRTFQIHLSSIGFKPWSKSFNIEDKGDVSLPAIQMSASSTLLDEVNIRLKHGIKFKEDTVEYHASDYTLRKNDAVGRLLRVMEGMDVDNNKGTLKYQGKSITTVRINGKDYAASDLAQVMKNLPADIVDKIQIVDDYGEMAKLTGIKEGEPQKVLNITTLADRSVGTTLNGTLSYGNNRNLQANAFLMNFNANRQVGVSGTFSNTKFRSYAVPPSFGPEITADPGYSRAIGPGLNFRDQLSKKVQLSVNYSYFDNRNRNTNNSYGQNNSTLGVSNFINHSTSYSSNSVHNLMTQLDYNVDSANTLQLNVNWGTNKGVNENDSYRQNINNYTSGFEHQEIQAQNVGKNNAPNLTSSLLFVHKFRKKDRLFSLQYGLNVSDSESEDEGKNTFRFFADTTKNQLVRDSSAHIIATRENDGLSHRLSANFTEPLGKSSRIEFLSQYNYSGNKSNAISDSVRADGSRFELERLSNIFHYHQEQLNTGVNYRFVNKKFNIALGARLLSTSMKGERLDRRAGANANASISDLRVIPAFRAAYSKTNSERLSMNYRATTSMPQFSQIQPFTDLTDANNIVVGNPDLKPSFSHVIDVNYSKFLQKQKASIGITVNYSYEQDRVQSNIIQRLQTITNGSESITRSINETHFVNLSGSQNFGLSYNLSKSWNAKYNVNYSGIITKSLSKAMSNNVVYDAHSFRQDHRLSANMTPIKDLDIFPSFGYSFNSTRSELQNSISSKIHNYSLALDATMVFLETYRAGFGMNKNITRGYEQLGNPSPFLLNVNIQKEFFKKRSLILAVVVNDLLNQNNIVQQTQTASGYTNTLSASQGRTIGFSISTNLQRWGGTPKRKGQVLKRRGDGSFIY